MGLRTLTRWLALGAIAVLSGGGCAATPTPGLVLVPTLAPQAEGLSYFPDGAPLVVLVRTDPQDPQWRALAEAGGLAPLEAAAQRQGILYAQVEPLLGHEAVIGIPRPGAAPLAALLTASADRLQTLAQSRVAGRRALPVGSYRGARLYVERGHAFAVRGSVLLVSKTTADLRAALDVRASEDEYDPSQTARLLPRLRTDRPPLARALVDLQALAPQLGPRAKRVPLLAAADAAAATARVARGALAIDARADVSGSGLTELELPISPGTHAPLAPAPAGAVAISVRDLAHTLGWAERTAPTAYPLAALRLQGVRDALRRSAHVDLDADILGKLHGPGTLVLDGGHVLLRAQPSRPADLQRALERVARAAPPLLRRFGLAIAADRGLYAIRRSGRVVARAGMVDGVFVAGTAPAAALEGLAVEHRTRPAGARGSATVLLPAGAVPGAPPWPAAAWLSGTPDEVDLAVRAPLP